MFATNLRRILAEKGMKQQDLVRYGFSKAAVSAWVNGKYVPADATIGVIADQLGCTVEELKWERPNVKESTKKTAPTTLTCEQVATLLHKHVSYVRQGLQQGRPGFEWGSAVKTSNRWSYCIYANKFTELTGIPVNV